VLVTGCTGTSHKANPGQGGSGPGLEEEKLDAAVRLDATGDLVRRETPPPAPPNGPIAPWAAKDIGAAGMQREEVRSSLGVMTVRSGGMEIGGTADSFQYISQKVRGDFELLARVRSLQFVDPDTKAGIMVRANDTEPGAANFFLAVLGDPMRGGLFQYRAAAAGPTTLGPTDTGVRANQWLRITRKGRTFTAYRSASRLAWTRVGSADLDLPPELSAGIAVSARNAMQATTAEIDGLRLQNLESQPATKDWSLEELGSIGGSAIWNGTTLAFSGLGDTPSLLSESGTFAYQTASGSQTLTVRVASFTHKDPSARMALMIREGPPVVFARTQPAVIIGVTPGMGVHFQSRAFNNLMATLAPIKDGLKAPIWLRLERADEPPPAGSRFTGSYSEDGRTWTVVGSASFALPEPYLIGVLGSSNGSTSPVTAALTDVSLIGGAAPAPPPAPPPDAGRPADASTDGRM
jgi:hypothetical protein